MGIPYPKEYGGAGPGRPQLRHRRGGAGPGGRRRGRHPVGPCVPGLLAHLRLRHRGAEAEIPGPPGQGGEDRRLRPHRAQRRVRRRRHGDHRRADKGDHYLLNGGKIFITNAPKADTYVVFAVTTPDIGTRGISAFIVEKGWKGFYFGDHYDKMGIRSSSTAELIFDNVEVPKENLLGKEGEGFKIAMATLDGGRIGIAAQALGIAQGAYEDALAYAKERVQFGKPIGFQQAISFKLADMATKLRCARFLVYSAAELKEDHAPYGMESAMAKMYASDIALEVTNDALQIHGGAGFMKGMEVERAYRDAKITTIYEGTNEIQRVVIASHILGKAPKERGRLLQPAQEARSRHRRAQAEDLPGRHPPGAGGRPGGAPEEGRPRLHRGHPHGHPHQPGRAGGFRRQGHRGARRT